MGNENFTQAMNKVEAVCGREVESDGNIYDIDRMWKTAKQALDRASSFFDNRTDAAADVLTEKAKWGKSACGEIAKALYNSQANGNLKFPESVTNIDTRKVAENTDTRAPDVQKNPGIWWYASNQKLERDTRANGL